MKRTELRMLRRLSFFGNHKGAIQQQNHLEKLITDNVVRGFTLPLPLDKIT
jgi:hypothetical protein